MENESIAIMMAERDFLREELRELKSCQVRYFSMSIGATGFLLGLAVRFHESGVASLAYLAPLAIVLPCWWIFFDKATTITRIVGYQQILESTLRSGTCSPYMYLGWETALETWRLNQVPKPPSALEAFFRSLGRWKVNLIDLLLVQTIHRYWLVNWLTFLSLAVFSLVLALLLGNWLTRLFAAGGVLAVVAVGSGTARVASELISGKYSYKKNTEAWSRLLSRRIA